MNTSPTDRTPGPGRHAYLSAGNASDSARNLLCSESRSSTNCFRIASAVSRFGMSCAVADRGDRATARDATSAALRATREADDDQPVTNVYRMVMHLDVAGRGSDDIVQSISGSTHPLRYFGATSRPQRAVSGLCAGR